MYVSDAGMGSTETVKCICIVVTVVGNSQSMPHRHDQPSLAHKNAMAQGTSEGGPMSGMPINKPRITRKNNQRPTGKDSY